MREDVIAEQLNITFGNVIKEIRQVKWNNGLLQGEVVNWGAENVKKLPRTWHG